MEIDWAANSKRCQTVCICKIQLLVVEFSTLWISYANHFDSRGLGRSIFVLVNELYVEALELEESKLLRRTVLRRSAQLCVMLYVTS